MFIRRWLSLGDDVAAVRAGRVKPAEEAEGRAVGGAGIDEGEGSRDTPAVQALEERRDMAEGIEGAEAAQYQDLALRRLDLKLGYTSVEGSPDEAVPGLGEVRLQAPVVVRVGKVSAGEPLHGSRHVGRDGYRLGRDAHLAEASGQAAHRLDAGQLL